MRDPTIGPHTHGWPSKGVMAPSSRDASLAPVSSGGTQDATSAVAGAAGSTRTRQPVEGRHHIQLHQHRAVAGPRLVLVTRAPEVSLT